MWLENPYILYHTQDHTKPVDVIRKWNVHFTGKNLLEFIDRIQELKEAYEITDIQLLQACGELLREEPLAWYRNMKDTLSTWNDLLEELKTVYSLEEDIEDQIIERKQRRNEKISAYVIHMQTLFRRKGNVELKKQIDRIYKNMLPEYKMHFDRDSVNTISEIILKGKRYETLQEEIKHPVHKEPFIPSQASAATIAYNQRTHCWKCKEPGHMRHSYKAQYKKFCSYCGKDGFTFRTCSCSKPGNEEWARQNTAVAKPTN